MRWLNELGGIAFTLGLLSSSFLLHTAVNADATNLNPTGAGCVDPEGYLACYAAQSKQAASCTDTINKTCDAQQIGNCLSACAGAQLGGNIGCWIQSCWNQVLLLHDLNIVVY